MDKVILDKLTVRAIIGIDPWERKTPQNIDVTIIAFTSKRRPGTPDTINFCLDYRALADEIRNLIIRSHRNTVEMLAEDVAQFCLQKANIHKVIVRIEKPMAIPDAKSAAVEIERSKVKRKAVLEFDQ